MKYGNVRLFRPAALCAAATLCLSNPTAANAQSSAMSAKIPFEFYVGKVRLPAGVYTVERIGIGDVVRVSGEPGLSVMVLTNANLNNNPAVTGELVFSRYADVFFLSEVRWSDFRIARSLPKSSFEMELAKNGGITRAAVAAIRP